MMRETDEYTRERELVLKLARVEEREILDIGAGPLARIAAERYDCFVTSIDISADKLEEAEADAEAHGVGEKISFEREDASDLSYCDAAFDIGICFCLLHHISPEKREMVIDELIRVVYERVVIAEFTDAGFRNKHGDDSFVPVDLSWLEERLKTKGHVIIHPAGIMNIYILEKIQ